LNGVYAEVAPEDAAGRSVGVIVEADAVEAIIILLGRAPENSQLLPEAAVPRSAPVGESWLGLNGVHTRLEGRQVRPTPAVKRQLADGIRSNDSADVRAGELYGRSFRGHLYDVFRRRHLLAESG